MTFYASVNNVLKRLDDYPAVSGESVWTRAEVELYVRDGYRAFLRQTKCLFDMFYPENLPTAGNYVADWERGYFAPGMVAQGLVGHTGGYWERDYAAPSSTGPVNLTQPWEATYLASGFLDQVFAASVYPIPEDNVEVARATHNYHWLAAEFTRYFETYDRSFQTTQGNAWRYSMDRDGRAIRFVPAGDGQATTYSVSGTWGLLRYASASEFGTSSPLGSWGGLREIPTHFAMGSPYGIPRRLFSDTNNRRVEYFRLGKEEELFEVPARFVKYAEYLAQAKALERDGPGQDLKLAEHFMGRFDEGVARMVRRLGENRRPVVGRIGSPGRVQMRPGLARLPYQYGRQIRRGVY